MSDKLRATLRDPQRLTARLLLAALLGLLAFMLAASPLGGPLSEVAVSQTASPTATPSGSPTATPSGSPTATPSGSPTATPTASPTGSPSAPKIAFLNPSLASDDNGGAGGSSTAPEISAKQDTDTSYHFVMWVTDVPQNPTVELKYQEPNREVTIGQATRVGSTRAFEFFWPGSSMPADGSFVFKAILFSGLNEVARVEKTFRVNNATGAPPPTGTSDPQGETAELIYPDNGGPFGFFTAPGATRAGGIVDVVPSVDTDSLDFYYTISAPGSEPVWTACGSASRSAAADGHRCVLVDPDVPSQVTAIGVQASDSDSIVGIETDRDSSDAHVVSPYVQDPTTMVVSPSTQTQVLDPQTSAFPCSQVITSTLLDQMSHKIALANVDVHATGPDDSLSFDDSGNNTSAAKAPDMGDHTTESTVDCESTTTPPPFSTSSLQGQHERPPGTPDIKHVESTTGTNDSGVWTFQLHSRAPGETQFTAWADEDGNDQLCSEEARTNGSIGWGQSAPTPSGVPVEQATCPKPSPTPTPSASPSASPTASPSPSGSPSPSPGTTCPGFENDTRPQIVGTSGDDDLDGTGQDEIICGLEGDDDISGGGGDDLILGGDGNDSIDGGAGNDEIDGGDGKDGIRGSGGNDLIEGGSQNDVIIGNAGNDEISGGSGEDIVRGGKDNDEITGGSGTDTLQGGKGRDTIKGNSEDDTVKGGRGHDKLKGGNHNDTIRGGSGNDELLGGKGDDTLRGDAGFDSCNGNGGNDEKFGCEN